MNKISIRFLNDRYVRVVWDDENSKWWFSVPDVIGVLNNEADHAKNRNYWKFLKGRLRRENSELVSVTNQLKLAAADGKQYNTDVLDSAGISGKWMNVTRTIERAARTPAKASLNAILFLFTRGYLHK